ncbi:hypothetical protein BJ912DRAFT_1050978 [Pholiota molesta]|nr:hypothetical protein BJ912DRAFT_1050978 [Pholiota molesta]
MASRSAFNGPRRKLVLAFDVGTTYSGISYSVLDPGQVPEIKGVTRFPAHEHISGASKIPTIIYYDRNGKVQAVGAEAMREGIYEQAEDEQWVKAECLADFLAYLFECASSYIQDTHANGVDLWASVKGQIDFVLSHPNGWEGTQQSEMRKAAVLAGLVPDTTAGHARLSFVTEGEASLHFAIQNGLPVGAMKKGDGVVIVDAGGGTIDVSSYSRNTSVSKETFEEVAAPQCHFHGSVFVSIHARLFLGNYLAESPFADDIEHIDGRRAVLRALHRCIIKAVLDQRRTAHKPISEQGGVGRCDLLLPRPLRAHPGVQDHVRQFLPYPVQPNAPDHRERISKTFISVSGHKRISDSFDVILPSEAERKKERELIVWDFLEHPDLGDEGVPEVVLPRVGLAERLQAGVVLRVVLPRPRGGPEVEGQNYTKLCSIDIDLSYLPLTPRAKSTGAGTFYRLDYDIVLLFGLTELKAQVAWKEGNVEKRLLGKDERARFGFNPRACMSSVGRHWNVILEDAAFKGPFAASLEICMLLSNSSESSKDFSVQSAAHNGILVGDFETYCWWAPSKLGKTVDSFTESLTSKIPFL